MIDGYKIINWEKIFSESAKCQNAKPFKHGFIEDFFVKDFYEKLYKTYPTKEQGWENPGAEFRKNSKYIPVIPVGNEKFEYYKTLSEDWNLFKEYLLTGDFVKNMSKYTNMEFSKIYEASFIVQTRGSFQLAHIDSDGKYKHELQIMLYFSKNWQKGDPGGTFLSKDDDESTIFFEPYNLDNSMICFEETQNSWHGTRYITKDVTRQALAISLY